MRPLLAITTICWLLLPALALDREAFVFTNYDLDVRIEPEQQRFAVRGKLTLRNGSGRPQKELALQVSSGLDWRSIRLDGKPVQFLSQPYVSDADYTGTLSEAIVSLPQEVAPKGVLKFDVGYEGTLPLDANRLVRMGVPEAQAKLTDWDQISPSFTAVRGAGHVVWYPMSSENGFLSEGNTLFDALGRWKTRQQGIELKAKFSFTKAGPHATPVVICSGATGNRVFYETNTQSSVDCSFTETAETSPTIVAGNYEKLGRERMDVLYLAGHKSAAQDFALSAEKAVAFITDWFSLPDKKAQFIELPDAADVPFENGTMLFTPLSKLDPKVAEIAAVHQFTHAALPSQRPWISEGLAHFAQALYLERQNGRRAALDFLATRRDAVLGAEKAVVDEHAPNAAADQSLINTYVEEFYRGKAAQVWWMLRDMVGEPTLRKTITAYRAAEDKAPSYIQRLIRAQTNRDLEWFFDDWVYRDRGLPDFHIESVYPRQTLQNSYLTTVTIENTGGAGAEVPVVLRFAGGEQTLRLEVHAKSKNSVRFNLPGMPTEVVVNDGSVPESDLTNNSFKVQGTDK